MKKSTEKSTKKKVKKNYAFSSKKIESIESKINYVFKNKSLLDTAMTHRSFSNDYNVESNERLEFLGDAILEYIVTEYLYSNMPEVSEGELTKIRAYIVCEESLYNVALGLNITEDLKIGNAQLNSGGRLKPMIADSIESIIAAIYVDSGISEAKKFILNNLKESLLKVEVLKNYSDYKSMLQEKLQEKGNRKIEYITIYEKGPDHDKEFGVELHVDGKIISEGIGKNKKQAQTEAAKTALIKMKVIEED